MYQIKKLICDCCGEPFQRGSALFLPDQKFFYNRAHKNRWERNRKMKPLDDFEKREPRYHQPGAENI